MTLQLSRDELSILKIWAKNAISGGHWGDGDMILGEEQSVMNKIGGLSSGAFDFNSLELRVLQFWLENTHSDPDNITGSESEVSLAQKVSRAYKTGVAGAQ